MRLYVEPMDCIIVDVAPDGRVQIEGEDLREPTLQERRAIIYAARKEVDALNELLETLQSPSNDRA